MKNQKAVLLTLLILLVLAILSCNLAPSESKVLDLYPTPTQAITQTAFIVQITTTPPPTLTPIVVVVSSTPESHFLCVTADENVYLRPSPSMENHPIVPLPKGARIADSGSRSGNWAFVKVEGFSGWVNTLWTTPCK